MADNKHLLEFEACMEEARQQSGLDDIGAHWNEDALKLLLDSLRNEAGMHAAGQGLMHDRIVKLLVNRLRVQDFIKRYPEIKKETIKAPVFIAAITRTGTTMLHRFIASDPRNSAVLWYECRNPAPLDEQDWPAKDQRIPLAEQEIKFMLEHYPGLDAIHPMLADAPDECIMLLEHTFCSGMPLSMADVPSYNEWEHHTDHTFAYQYYVELLQFLQWQKRRAGLPVDQGRWILKAPEHMGHVDIILKLFPDAMVIQSHREPSATIPSISSMIYSGWAAYSENPDKHKLGAYWKQRLKDYSDRLMDLRAKAGDAQFVDVWYSDLIKDPAAQAERIYQAINMPLDSDSKQAMDDWRAANQRQSRAPHQYTLEEYGFEEAALNQEFARYREQYLKA